jgi:hypothetical protein
MQILTGLPFFSGPSEQILKAEGGSGEPGGGQDILGFTRACTGQQ